MTDTPRTTAPAMEGDALTAEQIAEIQARFNHYGNRWYGAEAVTLARDIALIDVPRLLASHAALRDRLARAEERERVLRQAASVHLRVAEEKGREENPDGPLYGRYTITHKDGKPIDPAKRYFVLSPDSDPAARAALAAYIGACRATHPVLARSLATEYGIEPEDEWAGTIYDTAP